MSEETRDPRDSVMTEQQKRKNDKQKILDITEAVVGLAQKAQEISTSQEYSEFVKACAMGMMVAAKLLANAINNPGNWYEASFPDLEIQDNSEDQTALSEQQVKDRLSVEWALGQIADLTDRMYKASLSQPSRDYLKNAIELIGFWVSKCFDYLKQPPKT